MTVEEILSMSDKARRKLNQKELSSMVSYAAKKLNARLDRLSKRADVVDYALKNVEESGGRFGAKGKTYNQLQKELSRMRDFYESKTSTVSGAREVQRKQTELIFGEGKAGRAAAGKLSAKQRRNVSKQVFKAYRKFEESHPGLRGHGSDKYIREIARTKMGDKKAKEKDLIEAAEKLFMDQYAEEQAAREEADSEFWDTLIDDEG